MPELQVLDAGFASMQGLGVYGSQRYGISPGGAMDRLALAEANALTGRPAGASAIEVGPLPVRLLATKGSIRIAVSGAERGLTVGGRHIALGETAVAHAGEIIDIRGARVGRFSYLSVQGGFNGRAENGEKRTNGDFDPQAARSWVLQAGDVLDVGKAEGQEEKRLRFPARSAVPVRVVLGPQQDYFSRKAIDAFLSTRWQISNAANRMAYALEGMSLPLENGFNIVSDGTVTGSIQIPGSGQPLVILCDRGTIGGYPKIATIISADLGRFAQTPVGVPVCFEAVSVVEAQCAARDFADAIANVKPRVEIVKPVAISVKALLESNVAGDVFDAAEPFYWRRPGGEELRPSNRP